MDHGRTKGERETKDHLKKDCGEGPRQGRVEELECSQGGGTEFKKTTTDTTTGTSLKDVRAHRYCASLVRTLYMTWRVPRHVFQARAPSRNSTKYRADDLCGNLIC